MTRLASVVAAMALLGAGIACAQEFPTRPVRLIVPSAPEDFAEHVRKETARLGKLIKAIGIKPQ
jgi:tripartite-type tricarboxylate transporter receptor subunit TctC